MESRPNVVVIVSDTLRTAYLGCYGNPDIRTPNIDAFARRSVRFTRAYPESLPTIPVRRALHTGRRVFPFRDYRPVKWDIVYLPGWQPIGNDEDTLAENLAEAGYQTGFVTDTLPYFAPGFNFQRGFYQWEYIRGQQQDRWRSPYAVPPDRFIPYGSAEEFMKSPHHHVPMHLANTADVRGEQDTCTARTFQWGMRFLEDNVKGQPFYLMLDCFDPHEPWEAPEDYYRLYADPDFEGRRIIHCRYGPADQFGYTVAEMRAIRAHYCGLVTLVDTWFGKFMDALDGLGLADNTAVFFLSDHGTNFCDNPRNIIGKPHDAMYPGVNHLPLLVRMPREEGAGTTRDEFVYNIDVTATVYDVVGLRSPRGIDGRSLLPLLTGRGVWQPRDYVTCIYAHSLCYVDDDSWVLTDIDATRQEAYDLRADPLCMNPLAGAAASERHQRAWSRLLDDARGTFPDYREHRRTDAVGQTPTEHP